MYNMPCTPAVIKLYCSWSPNLLKHNPPVPPTTKNINFKSFNPNSADNL